MVRIYLREPYKTELKKFIDKLTEIGFKVPDSMPLINFNTDELYVIGERFPVEFRSCITGRIEFEIPDFMIEIEQDDKDER